MKLYFKEKEITNPNVMLISSGFFFDVQNPDKILITPEVIAESLSKLCRYGGHCPGFYSVAQHSVMCSYEEGTPEEQMEFLMHDSSEAFVVDIPRPIKNLIPEYRRIEDNLLKAIFEKFELNFPLSEKVKTVDDKILVREFNYFYNSKKRFMFFNHLFHKEGFELWSSKKSKKKFLARYYELKNIIDSNK